MRILGLVFAGTSTAQHSAMTRFTRETLGLEQIRIGGVEAGARERSSTDSQVANDEQMKTEEHETGIPDIGEVVDSHQGLDVHASRPEGVEVAAVRVGGAQRRAA